MKKGGKGAGLMVAGGVVALGAQKYGSGLLDKFLDFIGRGRQTTSGKFVNQMIPNDGMPGKPVNPGFSIGNEGGNSSPSGGSNIMWVVVAILAVIALGIGLFMFRDLLGFGGDEEEEDVEPEQNTRHSPRRSRKRRSSKKRRGSDKKRSSKKRTRSPAKDSAQGSSEG